MPDMNETEKTVSPALAEARARAAAAKKAAEAAKLSDEETELARLADEEESAKAEARAALAARRRIEMKQREADAKKEAAGRYFVRGVDLSEVLPLEADLDALPGRGIFVVRSADAAAERAKNVAIEAKEQHIDAIFADYAVACTVYPSHDDADGIRLRAFVDDPRYSGAVTRIVTVAHELIGLKQREAKRGRG